jgi:DNA-directed RNA polymerase specialized sigma subunit
MNQEKERAAPLGKAERDGLAVSHLWLVRCVYRELRRTKAVARLKDDLIGEGNLALVLAASEFDPNRGVEFRHFAQRRIRSAMLRYLGKENDYAQNTVPLDDNACRAAFYGEGDGNGFNADSDGDCYGGCYE